MLARPDSLVDVERLRRAYVELRPDPTVAAERVTFGTSGHRGCSYARTFNEWHVLAITQAICDFRSRAGAPGPLYIGIDTHALSGPAFASALEVMAANGVEVFKSLNGEYTPTPVISHAILSYNRGRAIALADGIVVTPSHNPPESGGFKYNPSHGGPAETSVTDWIEARANDLMGAGLKGVRRVPFERAMCAPTTHDYDYVTSYLSELGSVVDMELVRSSGIRIGVDPLGGAGVHYWPRIAERFGLTLDVVSDVVDPTFSFMPLDWDGRIRMDPSSPYAMQRLVGLKNRYDISFACDTDHDRHGIVTAGTGLLPPNHYLSVAADYLLRRRDAWKVGAALGKTVATTGLIDRVAKRLSHDAYEVPVGFKWFVGGLLDASLAFGCEESAGATFARIDGGVWTTDKDGIVSGLLAAEITASLGFDPGVAYRHLVAELGEPFGGHIQAPATPAQRARLAGVSAVSLTGKDIAGEHIELVSGRASGNGAPIGGIKVATASGWFVARPSGTEDIYKIYAESFRDAGHLEEILMDAQHFVNSVLSGASDVSPVASK